MNAGLVSINQGLQCLSAYKSPLFRQFFIFNFNVTGIKRIEPSKGFCFSLCFICAAIITDKDGRKASYWEQQTVFAFQKAAIRGR